MLNIFVCKLFAIWTLCKSNSFPKGAVISLAVGSVEVLDGSAACDAYRHTDIEIPVVSMILY